MTVGRALLEAREALAASLEDASLEAELLLRQALGWSRVRLYESLGSELTPDNELAFRELMKRRLLGEPAAYIAGEREFYGLSFFVDRNVLIPRPETEMIIERALEISGKRRIESAADIGTGCGAIAITLALEFPRAKVYATDLSGPALEVASRNCRRHGVEDRVHLLCGDLASPLPQPVDLMAANLPYVASCDMSAGLAFEPRLALDGGADGLETIRRFCLELGGRVACGGAVLLEVGLGQAPLVTSHLRALYPHARLDVSPDLAGIDRLVVMTLPG